MMFIPCSYALYLSKAQYRKQGDFPLKVSQLLQHIFSIHYKQTYSQKILLLCETRIKMKILE
jgi:hypothetical protein